MALDSPKLQRVLEEIESGVMQLPDFQREWKWEAREYGTRTRAPSIIHFIWRDGVWTRPPP